MAGYKHNPAEQVKWTQAGGFVTGSYAPKG